MLGIDSRDFSIYTARVPSFMAVVVPKIWSVNIHVDPA